MKVNSSKMNLWTCNFIWKYFEYIYIYIYILLSEMLEYPRNISHGGYPAILKSSIYILKGYYN
jgi:hypothetical protein